MVLKTISPGCGVRASPMLFFQSQLPYNQYFGCSNLPYQCYNLFQSFHDKTGLPVNMEPSDYPFESNNLLSKSNLYKS